MLGGELDYARLGIDDGRATGQQLVPGGAVLSYDFANSIELDDLRYDTAYLPGSTYTSPAYLESVRQDVDFDTFRVALVYRF